jgi:hypothetical protein
MEPVAGEGSTVRRILDHQCNCGGFVHSLPGNQLLDGEEDGRGDQTYIVSLRPECLQCMRYTVTYLAAIYAGDAATECYMPQYDDPRESHFDDLAAERWFENLPWLTPHRDCLIRSARLLASAIVRREQKAITALSVLLACNDGPVEGREAERIIREHLVSGSLADYPPPQ